MKREIIDAANAELKKIMDWFEGNKECFESLDLKLHDVSYYCYTEFETDFPFINKQGWDMFDEFCNTEYDFMIETFAEDDLNYVEKHIGRTSSFYLYDDDIIEFKGKYGNEFNWEYMLYNFVNENGYNDTIPDITAEGKIDETDKYLNDCEANLDYIIKDMYNEITKKYVGVVKMYEYIKEFKKNQVENFKDFCQGYEDDLKYTYEMECINNFMNYIEETYGEIYLGKGEN